MFIDIRKIIFTNTVLVPFLAVSLSRCEDQETTVSFVWNGSFLVCCPRAPFHQQERTVFLLPDTRVSLNLAICTEISSLGY